MAEILTQAATDDQIDGALTRCARECRYPIRLPDILQRVEGQEVPQLEAEARRSWEIVTTFAERWVQSTVEGNYVIDRGARSSEPPKLSHRILDTVRRTGGWRVYKCMGHEDFPFVRQRFLEEFTAWSAVEQIPAGKLLRELPLLQLVAKPIDQPKPEAPAAEMRPPAAIAPFKPKPIPVPLTDAQVQDRREMLRQQAESLKKNAAPVVLTKADSGTNFSTADTRS